MITTTGTNMKNQMITIIIQELEQVHQELKRTWRTQRMKY